ncbi:conserved Plasmodium protein, unknown function [Plasmodium vinckei]|uniref:SUZ domain-containing protein n=1 Tax=Plasmodium vinckei TaxID=5860 RepID=A0A6V7SE79_PLAVN|nr:conserved Plasmodium protein, unknown function [Plasmodium vinckei]
MSADKKQNTNICENENEKTCEDINNTIEITNGESPNLSMKNSMGGKKKIVLLKRNEIKYNKYDQGGIINNNNNNDEYENVANFNRRNNNKNNTNKYNLNGKNTKGEKTLEQREQEYNKIRARIFSNFNKNTKNNSTSSTLPNIVPHTFKNDNIYIIPPYSIPLNGSPTNTHIDPYFCINNYYNTYNNMINHQYVNNNNMPMFDINPIVNLPPSQFYCNTDKPINMLNSSENKMNNDIINCNSIPNPNLIYPNYPCNIQGYSPFLKFNNSQINHKKMSNANKYHPNYKPPNHITNFNNQNNMNNQKNNRKGKVKSDNNMTPASENATNKEKNMGVNTIRDTTNNISKNINGNTITHNNQSMKEENINYEQDHAPINAGFNKSNMNVQDKNVSKLKLSNNKKFYTSQNTNMDKKGKGSKKKTLDNTNITEKTLQNNTISYDTSETFKTLKNSTIESCTPPRMSSNISKQSNEIEPTNNKTKWTDIKNEVNCHEEEQTQVISTSSQKKSKKKSGKKKNANKYNTENANNSYSEVTNFNDIKNDKIDEQDVNTNNEKSNTTPKKKKKKKKKKTINRLINEQNPTLNPQPSIIIPNTMQTNFNNPNKLFYPLIVNNTQINSHPNYNNFINNIPPFQQYYPNNILNNLEYCRDISLYEKRYDRGDDIMLNPKRYDIDFPSLH